MKNGEPCGKTKCLKETNPGHLEHGGHFLGTPFVYEDCWIACHFCCEGKDFPEAAATIVELQNNSEKVAEEVIVLTKSAVPELVLIPEQKKVKCIECKRYKLENEMKKIFERGEGICKACWNFEDWEEAED